MCPSHEEEGQRARRGADGGGEWLRSRDAAPSNMVRSRGASQSTQLSPPPTPAEALARVQLLLDFPPAAKKLDEWRATVWSLVGITNNDGLWPVEPVDHRFARLPRASGGHASGDAATVYSPPPS